MKPGLRFSRWLALCLPLILVLTACSHWPGFKPEAANAQLDFSQEPVAFRLEGRVSVKAGEESFSGGLTWQRDRDGEALLLRTPLGQGLAEMYARPAGGLELKNSEGRVYRAADADALVKQALDLELPLRGLTWWVVGLPRPDALYRATPDAEGHLGELVQEGWRIMFSRYGDHHGRQLPGKLVAQRGEELEVRLVIDAWELP